MSATGAAAERRLLEQLLDQPTVRRRMLVVVNPYATTVSARLRNLVVYALQARYDVDAIDTDARGHARSISLEAAREGYDVVVAFGGDGTVNEVANGLAGSDTPLTCLPGGATNVVCRTLGIPTDVVEATEHLLALADDLRPRAVDLGEVNGRAFVFGSGVGLDASVVERVDANPALKARLGEYYFTWAAISAFARRYLVNPPRLRVEAATGSVEGVTAIVQNSDPYTYFGARPIRLARDVDLVSRTLSTTTLCRARPIDVPTLLARVFSARAEVVQRHRQIVGQSHLPRLRIVSIDDRPLPMQVDGDYVGDETRFDYRILPGALKVVS
ncbi:MAG: NAD(+)/NADH kinase [Thermoleophilaceae bacterium]|nr:NAD(+)/NADH kinase [Thermoleophilaceae bacterium]